MQAEPRAVTPTSRATFVAVLTTVTCLRLYYCTCLPVNTGDVTRHLAWGCVINQSGYAAADRPLADKHPAAKRIVWSHLPFSYPVVSLLFDQLTAALWASIFWMKLTLTLLEALTAFLIYRYTGERALALLYWASPLSVWWCSHEGQIEPLQNALAVGSLLALHGRGFAAGGLLALATQAKLTAICCSKAPDGRRRWTLRLLANRLVELNIVGSISYETVRRTLQKTS